MPPLPVPVDRDRSFRLRPDRAGHFAAAERRELLCARGTSYANRRRGEACAGRHRSGRGRSGASGFDVPYTLDTGDRLRITVFGQEGLTNSYSVDASGKVMLPLIGSVTARGHTDRQLATAITERLRQGFIREPHVAVDIELYRPFFILGEVAYPGQYPFVPNMTAETAVAIAGGFTPRASREIVQLGRLVDGQPFRGRTPLATPVRPGDTVMVEERWF